MHSGIVPIILFAVFLIVLFRNKGSYAGLDPEYLRRRDLAALAKKLQLEFSAKDDFNAPKRLSFISWMNRGIDPSTNNTFHGYYQGYPVIFFDCIFSGGKNYTDYWSTYLLEMKTTFPVLHINHETMESHIAETAGLSHITFESAEFSHAFSVRSSDKKFASEVCHQRMMEFLLANQDLTIEINGKVIALLFKDWLRPEKVEHNLSRLIEFRKLWPDFLFEKPRN